MPVLPAPVPSGPILFGVPAPPGALLSWAWAEQRLVGAREYWIATTRPDGRPHCRPVWGVWLADGFRFSTGSLATANLAANGEITVHLGDGQEVVILEGTARVDTERGSLQAMCDVYGPKYDYPISPTDDGAVRDAGGLGGPVHHVTPRVVFGWERDMTSPTRWTFAR